MFRFLFILASVYKCQQWRVRCTFVSLLKHYIVVLFSVLSGNSSDPLSGIHSLMFDFNLLFYYC